MLILQNEIAHILQEKASQDLAQVLSLYWNACRVIWFKEYSKKDFPNFMQKEGSIGRLTVLLTARLNSTGTQNRLRKKRTKVPRELVCVQFSIAVQQYYKLGDLNQHKLITSQFCGERVCHGLAVFSTQGLTHKMLADSGSHLDLVNLFQAHSDLWQNSVPFGCRTEVPVTLQAISQWPLSAFFSHKFLHLQISKGVLSPSYPLILSTSLII